MLSRAEIAQFKEQGFLILRGFLDKAEVHSWREAFWAGITARHPDVDPDDDSTWLEESEMASDFKVPFGSHPKVQAVIEQLGAGNLQGGNAGMNIRWPQRGMDSDKAAAALDSWRAPSAGHVDGYVMEHRWLEAISYLTFYWCIGMARAAGPGGSRSQRQPTWTTCSLVEDASTSSRILIVPCTNFFSAIQSKLMEAFT